MTTALRATAAPVALLAACSAVPLNQPVEFRGVSALAAPQRDEVLWALAPYAAAAAGCAGNLTGVDVQALPAAARTAAGELPGAAQRELWIAYLCAKAVPVYLTLRPQPDGRMRFAFDTQP